MEKIKKEILQEAKTTVKSILDDGKKEVKRIKAESEEHLKKLTEKQEAIFEKSLELYETQHMAAAGSEVHRLTFEMQKEVLTKVKFKALNLLSSLDDTTRSTHVHDLADKCSKSMYVARIYVNEKDLSAVVGREARSADIIGGIIAEDSDGKTRIDLSYEQFLENVFESNVSELMKTLFN